MHYRHGKAVLEDTSSPIIIYKNIRHGKGEGNGKGKGKFVPVLFLTEHHAMKT
jgi:hypothetical protein